MNKKGRKREDGADAEKTIAELFGAIEELESNKRQPGEGILAVARELAAEWKIKNRSLFEGLFENKRLVLLVALVVALRRSLKDLERIGSYLPGELENLKRASIDAELRAFGSFIAGKTKAELRALGFPRLGATTKPLPKQLASKQKYDQKRSLKRLGGGEIEQQFGDAVLGFVTEPSCLDKVFAGNPVSMMKLQRLFGMDRHRLSKILRGGARRRRYDCHDVAKIMDSLLSEKPRKKRKRSKPGRPSSPPWLNGLHLRMCVLSGIETRLKRMADYLIKKDPAVARVWQKQIADPFLDVIHHHLPDSGKK